MLSPSCSDRQALLAPRVQVSVQQAKRVVKAGRRMRWKQIQGRKQLAVLDEDANISHDTLMRAGGLSKEDFVRAVRILPPGLHPINHTVINSNVQAVQASCDAWHGQLLSAVLFVRPYQR